ncbi:hypothetical protein ACFOWE_18630 [Planomonospora corallina]|uniref:Uncharacterized protein n=1 Tax=Planomonospora corallina TaxID=1806052 RepID=A0ABV8IBL2_9ACTN
MKRGIKTAVAVAAFGLAAAICTPAQAQEIPSLGGKNPVETVSMAVRGLAGGLTNGRAALDGLTGGQGAAPAAPGVVGKASGTIERLLGISAEHLTSGAQLRDLTGGASLRDVAGGQPLRGLTGSGPLQDITGGSNPLTGAGDSAGHIIGATNGLTHSGARAVENVQGTVEGAEGFTYQRPRVEGLVDGLNQAVPQGAERAGTLAPLVGNLAPSEAGSLVGSVEPVTRSASIDELSPLLDSGSARSGEAATGTLRSVTGAVRGVTEDLTR